MGLRDFWDGTLGILKENHSKGISLPFGSLFKRLCLYYSDCALQNTLRFWILCLESIFYVACIHYSAFSFEVVVVTEAALKSIMQRVVRFWSFWSIEGSCPANTFPTKSKWEVAHTIWMTTYMHTDNLFPVQTICTNRNKSMKPFTQKQPAVLRTISMRSYKYGFNGKTAMQFPKHSDNSNHRVNLWKAKVIQHCGYRLNAMSKTVSNWSFGFIGNRKSYGAESKNVREIETEGQQMQTKERMEMEKRSKKISFWW